MRFTEFSVHGSILSVTLVPTDKDGRTNGLDNYWHTVLASILSNLLLLFFLLQSSVSECKMGQLCLLYLVLLFIVMIYQSECDQAHHEAVEPLVILVDVYIFEHLIIVNFCLYMRMSFF